MPTITAIKEQQRRDARFNIFIDGKFAVSLSDLELSNSGLSVGQEVDLERVLVLQSQSQTSKVLALAMRYVAIRPRSVHELRDYLRRKQVEPSDVEPALARLQELGLLDDREFAAAWIRSRQAVRPRSRRMLEQELATKGVSRDLAVEALAELDEDVELKALADLMERKRRLPQYAEREKLMAFFARQGYTYDLIKRALEQLDT